ncbi:MAG TPA: hypothetical protein VIO56_05245 [Methylotenera sp.]|jgi:hypothetical protein
MKKQDILKGSGAGSLPRILDAINCFRRRYGHWPTFLRIDAAMIDGLQQDNITPAGWKALTDKVQIHRAEGKVIAEDGSGQSYEYESEFMKPESKATSADYWIWGCEVWPSNE